MPAIHEIQRRLASTPNASVEVADNDVQKKALRGMSFAEGDAALAPVQMRGNGAEGDVHAAAAHGLSGAGGAMPHLGAIQRSFGGHDVSQVRAHTDAKASAGAAAMGAEAYATGNSVAFGEQPSLHTAAHEAAHIVQQRAGVALSGGVGKAGDSYEQQADAVADKVVKGESAESILSESTSTGASTSGAATQQQAVQRYEKKGTARVSDGHNLVVADGAPHNLAYAPAGDIAQGQQNLAGSGSNLAMAAGPALNPGDYGLQVNDVAANLRQVQVSAAVPNGGQQQDLDTQNENSIVLAHQYELMAKNVLASLNVVGATPENQLITEMETLPLVKGKVAATYTALNGNYTPTNILAKARAQNLEDKYIEVIMNHIISYQEGIRTELKDGGVTTPKDCGQVARNFVRGTDVRYHKLTTVEQQQKGYTGHYFSMVLGDGSDKVSLENAVGGSKYEQLWKSANFDFMWHFEMRGAQVDPNHDVGEEEMHSTGESKQANVRSTNDAQHDVKTVRNNLANQAMTYASEGLTSSSDTTTDKNSWKALRDLAAPVAPQEIEREKDLLMAGLVYANKHIADAKKGRKSREKGWKAAVQLVIDRGGENAGLAKHVHRQLVAIRA